MHPPTLEEVSQSDVMRSRVGALDLPASALRTEFEPLGWEVADDERVVRFHPHVAPSVGLRRLCPRRNGAMILQVLEG